MKASKLREWCLRAITQLNVVESELELELDHDLILGQWAKVKEMVEGLLEKAVDEEAKTVKPKGAQQISEAKETSMSDQYNVVDKVVKDLQEARQEVRKGVLNRDAVHSLREQLQELALDRRRRIYTAIQIMRELEESNDQGYLSEGDLELKEASANLEAWMTEYGQGAA